MKEVLGTQVVVDCWGCNEQIASAAAVRAAVEEAVARAGVTLLNLAVHEFHPQGVSAVALLAESHLFVHAWPEKSYLAVDFFTCGKESMPEQVIQVICEAFRPAHTSIQHIERGIDVRQASRPAPRARALRD